MCVYTEGAGAVIFASEEKARAICANNGKPPIWITGVGASNEHSVSGKDLRHKYMGRIWSDYFAAQAAYKMAGITDPVKQIQVVELHDAFIKQLQITMGEMGFVKIGRTDALIEEEIMKRPDGKGKVLINPSGGLTFGGHFVGGSNIFSTWSARREMIEKGFDHGLIHGTGSTIAQYGVAMVLERR
jgi:acetyl-CoA acetyltransferase